MSKRSLSTFLALTAITTGTLHLINKIQFSGNISKEIIDYKNCNYYEWRFGKIRYCKNGSGTPLLLIHDLTPGSSSYEFHKIYQTLSSTHEVYVLDLLGYGSSDKPNMTYTNYLYVQLIVDFIKNIIGRKTNIIATGHSASTAIMACHNDPDVFKSIFLVNPESLSRLNLAPSHNTKLLKFLIDIPILGTFVYNMLTTKESFKKTFRQNYFYDPAVVTEDMITSYTKFSHMPDYNAKFSYSSYIGRYMNSNIVHALKEVNHCIYILYGKDQNDIDEIIANYVFFNSAIEIASIPHSARLPHLEQPNEFLSQLEIFLS